MAINDLYPNLPGNMIELTDGNLRTPPATPTPTTGSVLLLGTAVDGPVGEPVAVTDLGMAYRIFGSPVTASGVPNGATLVKGAEEAWAGGCRDLRLLRISGTYASANILASSRSVAEPDVKTETLGTANGNLATSFTVSHPIKDGTTVKVYANGVQVAANKITVTYATGKVDLQANACDSEATISIEYTYVDGGTDRTVTEVGTTDQSGNLILWVAHGANQNFTLIEVPNGTVRVYANGEMLDAESYSVTNKTLTLKPGYAKLGATIVASYGYMKSSTVTPSMTITGYYPGSLYNSCAYEVVPVLSDTGVLLGKELILYKPKSKELVLGEGPLRFSSVNYPTFRDLVNAVNSHPSNNAFRLSVDAEYENIAVADLELKGKTYLTGGSDQLNLSKDQIYQILGGVKDSHGNIVTEGIYQRLENYAVDYIVPLGVYADDPVTGLNENFAYQLALACAIISYRNRMTLGVIAINSPKTATLDEIASFVNNALTIKHDFFMLDKMGQEIIDANGNKIDIGMYIQMVAGPDLVFNSPKLGRYACNSAAAYAGLMSSLPAGVSPVNRQLPGLSLRYTFSNYQRDRLTGARFVTYTLRNNGSVVAVEDAMTCAQPTSDYIRVTSMLAVKYATDAVRRACEPYRALAPTSVNRNSMGQAIEKALEALKNPGSNGQPVITDYSFNLVGSVADLILGNFKIELSIVPPFEIRRITTVVSLVPAI